MKLPLIALFLVFETSRALGAPPVSVDGFTVVAIIALPGVNGRIDHLAYDPVDQTVFIAELGNGTVEAVNVATRKVEHRLTGFGEPQGVAYSPALGRLYVASGDGRVKSFRRADLSLDTSVDVGADADNLRIDERAGRLYVGHGDGALAVLDVRTLARIADIHLKAHPESFQLAPAARLVVNVPDAGEIAIVDTARARQVGRLPNGALRANYPMAIDASNHRVLTVYRQPARIVAWDVARAAIVADEPTCNDADDVFVDERRQRVYVICGEGVVEVLSNPALQKLARLRTAPGARTGLFSVDADRLFVAARGDGNSPAALWVLAPAP
jgi:DNA-binding beta-propeller fold protein YncE